MSTKDYPPLSEDISAVSSRSSRSRQSDNEDVAATRHLRLMISSIAENTSLTPQQRQDRICNFEKLLEEAEQKLHFNGGVNDDALMLDTRTDAKRKSKITTVRRADKKEKSKKKSFFGRFRRKSKPKNIGVGIEEHTGSVNGNAELETVVEERQDEVQKQESQTELNHENVGNAEETKREEPSEERGQQPSNIFIPTPAEEPPTQQEDDEATHADSIIDVRTANSEDYAASICSIRSLGTFEKDFINNIISEQQEVEEISVSTFEQDAGMVRGVRAALPTEVGVQLQQQVAEDDDLTLEPVLSETTFERDARKASVDNKVQPPVQVEFSKDGAVMMQEEEDDIDDLSETTFEQDHKTVMTEMVSQPDIQAAMSGNSLRSVSTFEKDAAARAALAVKIGRIPSTKPKVIEEVTSEGTFEKDQRLRQALSQRSRRSKVSVASSPCQAMSRVSIPAIAHTESVTVYEREAKQKSKENNPHRSQQYASYSNLNDGDDKSRFERDASRNMTSHPIKVLAVPQNPAPLPRINDLVLELSPGEVQKQQKQLARQRSGNRGMLSRFKKN